jgi:hypothetical protein
VVSLRPSGYLTAMDRDLIGYGAHPPDPKWPAGARLALNFVLNYEEGSEPSVPDGDPASEWGLTENGMLNPGVTGRDLAAEGMFAYGSRVAFWRVMRLFAERNLPLTVFGCALALERHPPAAAAVRAAGHDNLLPWLALGEALRAVRGRGERADPPRCRIAAGDHGRAAPRLVLPLRAKPEHPEPAGRGGWVSL